MTLDTGQIIDGKYRIVRILGTGGMGAVYEGENVRIRRRVAIKVLHPHVSEQAESVARFEREAQAAARIGSDHICEVLDLGALDDGTRFMVLEYLEGETLSQRIKRSGRLSPEHITTIMAQVLDGLGAAHTAGIVHRDLKPDNVFILPMKGGRRDFVKILDFGVSKFSPLAGGAPEEMSMTRSGSVVGTPYYMSPEQARGTPAVDGRSDIYAMGVLLYQATTGKVPFQASTFNELLFKIVLEPAPPPQYYVPNIDPEFAAIIQQAMARDPMHRYQTCADFKGVLLTWLASRGVHDPNMLPVPSIGYGPGGAPLGIPTPSPGTPQGLLAYPFSGTPPPGAVGMGTPPPGYAMPMVTPHGPITPPPLSGRTPPPASASLPTPPPGTASGDGATANSWGHASGAIREFEPRPRRRVGLALGAAALLIAGGAAAFAMFGSPSGPGAQPEGTTAPAGPVPPASTEAPSAPSATASADPAADATAAPTSSSSATAAAASVSAEPSSSPKQAAPARPPPRPPPPRPPTTGATKTPPKSDVSGDFGY